MHQIILYPSTRSKGKCNSWSKFFNTIYPIARVDNQWLRTKPLDEKVLSKFANSIDEININVLKHQAIKAKENHINSLSQEIG